MQVSDDLITASDSGLSSVLILLDFSRAFDCLDPKLLIAKLRYYGFSEDACKWFETYLIGREQYVEVEDRSGIKKVSSVKNIPRGTPQGSILSPILFSIFKAHMPDHIKICKYHLYADDTQIYHSFKAENTMHALTMVNEDLNQIYEWATRNSLILNPAKSKMLIIGTKTQVSKVLCQNPNLTINGIDVPIEPDARNLGLIMDGELRFVKHINDKIKNAFYKLKILYNIRKYISESIRILLCDTLVLSPFNYCSSVYGPRLWAKTEGAIQRVQNACARFCFSIPRREHVTPYLINKGILNMKSRRELHLACLTQKVIWNKKPEYLFEKLIFNKDTHHLNTRSKLHNKLAVPKHNTAGFQGCFRYRTSKIWNDLPPPLRKNICGHAFKILVKRFLFHRQQCNFEATFKSQTYKDFFSKHNSQPFTSQK